MDANTDPHVIRANPKYLYNIWTLVMVVAIKNIDPFTWNLNKMYIKLVRRVMIY